MSKKKMPKYIAYHIEISSDKEYSNEESSDDSHKENSNKEGDFEEAN